MSKSYGFLSAENKRVISSETSEAQKNLGDEVTHRVR